MKSQVFSQYYLLIRQFEFFICSRCESQSQNIPFYIGVAKMLNLCQYQNTIEIILKVFYTASNSAFIIIHYAAMFTHYYGMFVR